MLLVGRGVQDVGLGCGPVMGNERGKASLRRSVCLRDPSAARAWPPGHPDWGWAGIQPALPALRYPGLNPCGLSSSPKAAAVATRWPPRAPSARPGSTREQASL